MTNAVKYYVYLEILFVGSIIINNICIFQGNPKSPSSCKPHHPGLGTGMLYLNRGFKYGQPRGQIKVRTGIKPTHTKKEGRPQSHLSRPNHFKMTTSTKYMFQQSRGLFCFRKTKRLRQAHRPWGGWSAHTIATSYRYTDTLTKKITSIQTPKYAYI